ncbi:MAG: cysteine--tRNA ligase [Candidatus Sungbacteria bacterium]|nr:cysteine--tRNA ligase [Candidatus Sungbacteria bacterium]
MPIRFRNTLTRKKEVFKPRHSSRADFFVCGPTVYDHSHIGHARTYVAFDGIVSYLRLRGYKVKYVMNITDIDDKIINRAREINVDPLQMSRRFTENFYEDMRRLGVKSVSNYAPASKYIPQIIKQIKRLIKRGYAYESYGSVYFSVNKFKGYGKLSHQVISKLKKFTRLEIDPAKRESLDFVLWKAAKPNEPSWPSPWGPGRPGWHIEDTAISESFFGSQYDIHGGAVDLIFPHHESEIAQQEAASGKKPFVRIWLHTGLLNIGGQKMAKSLKNFIPIKNMLARHSPEDFRMLVFRAHYRSPLNYTEELLKEAHRSVERLGTTIRRLRLVKEKTGREYFSRKIKDEFIKRLDDDFDTPQFLAYLFSASRGINSAMDKRRLSKTEALSIIKVLCNINSVLKIMPLKLSKFDTALTAEIKELFRKREVARKAKNWRESDALRDKIIALGWSVKDTPSGSILEKVQG